jgi:short-subunit dehydrogenase
MTEITEKTILLTGASRGLGRYMAHHLARQKATIIGVSRSPSGLDQVGAEVEQLGGKWYSYPFDISQVEKLHSLIKSINQKVSSIDILINNAGIEIYRSFPDYSLHELQLILTTNLLAAIELTRLVMPQMLKQGSGHLVNMASLAGKKGPPYNSIYAASKAGLLMWSDAIRQELAGTGVKVSSICPGYVSQQGMSASTGIPLPKLAGISTPQNVADAVIKAILYNKTEVIVNQNLMTEGFTKFLLVIKEIFPQLTDVIYQELGVTQLNQKRII